MDSFSACKLLSPPYLTERSWRPKPELGSILLWRPQGELAIGSLHRVLASAPWCSLVVELPAGVRLLDRNALFDTLSAAACLPVFTMEDHDPVAAIQARRPPTDAEVVRYIRRRPESAHLGAQLAYLLSDHMDPLSARSVRRRVRKASLFKASHWERVIRVAQVKTKRNESAEALAGRYGWDVRTMRSYIRECCDTSLEEFRHRVGWEWRVEAALRLDAPNRIGSGGVVDGRRVDRPLIRSHCPLYPGAARLSNR